MDKESSPGFIERCRKRLSIEDNNVPRAPLNREEIILWRPLKDHRDWDLFPINTFTDGEHLVRTIHRRELEACGRLQLYIYLVSDLNHKAVE